MKGNQVREFSQSKFLIFINCLNIHLGIIGVTGVCTLSERAVSTLTVLCMGGRGGGFLGAWAGLLLLLFVLFTGTGL